MPGQLIQLPKCGDWVDPGIIASIQAFREIISDTVPNFSSKARVIVSWHGGTPRSIDVDTYEEACTLRDEIAEEINGARRFQ